MRYSLQTKRLRRAAKAVDDAIRAEADEYDMDGSALQELLGIKQKLAWVVDRVEVRDIEASLSEEAAE